MTLIVVSPEGLYCDKKQYHVCGGMFVPSETCKIFWPAKEQPSYALALTGKLGGLQNNLFEMAVLINCLNFLRWWQDNLSALSVKLQLKKFSIQEVYGCVNLPTRVSKLLEGSIDKIAKSTSIDGGFFINRFGNYMYSKELDLVSNIDIDLFDAMGSSGKPAAMLKSAGYDVDSIYRKCSEFDSMISADYYHLPRTSLAYNVPLRPTYAVYFDNADTLTKEQMADLLVVENIVFRLFHRRKNRNVMRPPTATEILSAATVALNRTRGFEKATLEVMKRHLHEYYHL